ncbi:MAG: pantetheine-phosphate adenylyltransferase [Spirochaetales bacterium]|nr:pantetheine-phosphate adenylyltransferase [Spirochaetales bacterium]
MQHIIYPGTFDPPTNGHLNVISRASKIFEKVDVVIAVNSEKKCFFDAPERFSIMKEIVQEFSNVSVNIWEGLIVDYAKKVGARMILRGVRALSDFNYEFELSMMNRALSNDIETILLPTDQKYFVLRSSAIKELAKYDGDISKMVPPAVEKALKRKMQSS